MFTNADPMMWSTISFLVMDKLEVFIHFESGNVLHATAAAFETVEEILSEALKYGKEIRMAE